jgi:hypothetical protein
MWVLFCSQEFEVKDRNLLIMGYINAKSQLIRRKQLTPASSSIPGCDPCPVCNGKVEWVKSILVKFLTGYGAKYVEDKDNPNLQMVGGQLIETFVMKKVSFPKLEKRRICGSTACLKYPRVREVIAEWTPGSHTIPDGDETRYNRGSKAKGDLTIDPSWMTSRGKRF